jgi:hypothetical protein
LVGFFPSKFFVFQSPTAPEREGAGSGGVKLSSAQTVLRGNCPSVTPQRSAQYLDEQQTPTRLGHGIRRSERGQPVAARVGELDAERGTDHVEREAKASAQALPPRESAAFIEQLLGET